MIFEKFELGPKDNPIEWVVFIFLTLLFGRIVFLFFTAFNNTKGRFFFSADMRLNLLGTILKKPGAESLNLSTGDALNRIKEDVNQLEDFAFGAALDVITSFVLTVFALGILVSIDWIMTLYDNFLLVKIKNGHIYKSDSQIIYQDFCRRFYFL